MDVSFFANVAAGGMIFFLVCGFLIALAGFFILEPGQKERAKTVAFRLSIASVLLYLLFGGILIIDDTSSSLMIRSAYLTFLGACAMMVAAGFFHSALSEKMWIVIMGAGVVLLFISFIMVGFAEDYAAAVFGTGFGVVAGVFTGICTVMYYRAWARFKEQGFARPRTPEEKRIAIELRKKYERPRPRSSTATSGIWDFVRDGLLRRAFSIVMGLVSLSFGLVAFSVWAVAMLAFLKVFDVFADIRIRSTRKLMTPQ